MRAETAAYIEIWVRRIVTVGVSGIAFANVALLLGLHHAGYLALLRMVMLVVHLFIVVIILQCRRQVADAIRAPAGRTAPPRCYAIVSPPVALSRDRTRSRAVGGMGTQYPRRLFAAAAIFCRHHRGRADHAACHHRGAEPDRSRFPYQPGYSPAFSRAGDPRQSLSAVAAQDRRRRDRLIGFVALLEVWGVDAIVWFYGGQIGSRMLSAVATIGIAALAAAVIWEASNALMDRQLNALSRDGHYARAARLRTFQPMLRTALLCLIVTVVGLTALSEIGVNVAPLLAGAGIVGIAIGFGSQKLVQDVITGLFLLLENTVQVGDNVSVSGLTGTVENVSIRTIRLRAGDGAVHIVPSAR